MRKALLLTAALALTTSNAMAASYFSKHVTNNQTTVDFSVNKYTLDLGGNAEETETGYKLALEHKSYRNVGVEAGLETVDFDKDDILMARFGANMNLLSNYKEFDLKASLGIFSLDAGELSKSSLYAGLTFEGELVKNQLSGKVYTRYYDIKDNLYGRSQLGAQLNYHLNRNMNVFISSEKHGEFKSIGAGISYKF